MLVYFSPMANFRIFQISVIKCGIGCLPYLDNFPVKISLLYCWMDGWYFICIKSMIFTAYGKEGVKMNFIDRIFIGELTSTVMCEECAHVGTGDSLQHGVDSCRIIFFHMKLLEVILNIYNR